MREFQVWRKTPALALASVLVLAAAGCGDDSDDPSDDPDEGAASESLDREELESPGTFDCALPSETPTEITDLTFTGVEPDGGGFGGTRGSLAWQGCTYETDGDAQVMIAIIVDAQGEPDVASYDEFAEGAGRSSEPVLVDGVGDSAVRYRDRLYFKSGDTAYAVSGEDDQDDPLAPEVLDEIAAAVVDAG